MEQEIGTSLDSLDAENTEHNGNFLQQAAQTSYSSSSNLLHAD